MLDRLEDFMKLPYSIKVVPDQTTEGSLCYVASHPELPGCMSHGDTLEEAEDNLSKAKELYIETLLEKGESIPSPKSRIVAIWQVVSTEVAIPSEDPYLIRGEINAIEPLEQNREKITMTY